MKFFRIIKPKWSAKLLENGKPNPDFIEEVKGPNVIEGVDYSPEFLKEKNELGYNIFFFPNHPSTNVYKTGVRSLSGRHIDVFNYIFIDMDLKDKVYASKEEFLATIKEFTVPPTMVVDSGNGIHVYWAINNLTREVFVASQLALIKYFKTDDSVSSVLQLLRYPGYMNTKVKTNPILAHIIKEMSTGKKYDITEFPAEMMALDKEQLDWVENHIARLEGRLETKFSEINSDEIPQKFKDLMEVKPKIKALFEDPRSVMKDRSSADMALANILFSLKFDINETLAVISNSQKALEKGSARMQYAKLTVSKVYETRKKHKFQSVSEYIKDDNNSESEPPVNGPKYLDFGVLGEPWRKKELLGLIAGAGTGKTTVALNIVRDIIKNNPHNDEIFIFFSLEMSKGQIIKRWIQLNGKDSKLTDRLYVIDRLNDENLPVNIGLQEIYEYCTEIMQMTGKKIGAIVLDHFHIISTHIDVTKSPNFGIRSEQNTGHGDIRNLSLNGLATQLKSLVQTLNTFGILLSQTTKEKGAGDTALGKDAAYGVSQYEWIVDRIITIWQPLLRVQNMCKTKFLAYQYAKIREKRPNDKIRELEPKLLVFSLEDGSLSLPNKEEYNEFRNLLPMAIEARENAVKHKGTEYSIQMDINDIKRSLDEIHKQI